MVKISISFYNRISKKSSYERRDYELIDDNNIPWAMSPPPQKKKKSYVA